MPSEKRWVDTDPRRGISWYEQRPYSECPNCGRYEYRKLRMLNAGIIRCLILGKDPYYTTYSACKNCKHQTEQKKEEV